VANALIHALEEPGEGDPLAMPRKLDRRYLDRIRATQRLNRWRELAMGMAAPA
jgi:hypothetical protein